MKQGSRNNSIKSSLFRRSKTPSDFMITVALRDALNDQSFLAKSITRFQFGQRHVDTTHLTGHQATSVFNDVVVIAGVALLQNHFTSGSFDTLKTPESSSILAVGKRDKAPSINVGKRKTPDIARQSATSG